MGHSSVAFTLSRYASFVPNYGDTAVGLDEALGEPQEVIRTRSAMFRYLLISVESRDRVGHLFRE